MLKNLEDIGFEKHLKITVFCEYKVIYAVLEKNPGEKKNSFFLSVTPLSKVWGTLFQKQKEVLGPVQSLQPF